MDTETERLVLHPVDREEARRIHDRAPAGNDRWADDFPFGGDVAATGALLQATALRGDQRPFGYSLLRRRSDGLAIGGIGFKGPPEDGALEVGYGLAPSARGQGYATEALIAMLGIAAGLGVAVVRADTEPDNVASQRTLEKAGFLPAGGDRALRWFERRL